MKKIIMTKGLPASGKSTWAKSMLDKNTKRINKDDLRSMIDNGHWSKENEKFIIKARNLIIEQALKDGYSIIVDDTNFAKFHEDDLRDIAVAHGASLEIKDFTNIPLEECIARDKKRQNYVGEDVIRKMHRQYLAAAPVKHEWLPERRNCVIVDIDGTLAQMNGRSPYDWKRVGEDSVNEPVRLAVKALEGKADVIVVSGRDEICREETISWLNRNNINFTALHMRKHKDNRKDDIVKMEIYEEHIKDKYNVLAVYDDRDSVIRMWRSLGLSCFQVNYGDF